MIWKKSKLTRWTAGDYRITDDPDSSEGNFRLDSPRDFPQWFSTLDQARAAAKTLNELFMVREENERLRAELAQARGEWPAAPAQSPATAAIASKLLRIMDRSVSAPGGVQRRIDGRIGAGNGNGHDAEADTEEDDGRGIPHNNGTADGSEMPF